MRIGNRILATAVVSATLTAGLAQERPNGLFLTRPLGLSFGYDDNFPLQSTTGSDSVTLLTSPTFSWMRSTHRGFLSADYQGEFEIFSHNRDLDSWNHAAALRYRYQLSPRLGLELGDSFLSTSDPTRRLQNSLLLLPRGRFNENSAFARFAYRLDRKTTLSVRLDQVITKMDLQGDLDGRLDRAGFAGTFTVDRSFNRHHAIEANYAYLYVHALKSGPNATDNHVNNANMGYIYTVNPGLAIRVFGGASRAFETSFTGALGVDKKIGGVWLSAGYQRYVSFFGGVAPSSTAAVIAPQFASGVAPNSIYTVASLRMWGNITRRVGIDGTFQRALNGVTREQRGLKSVIGQLRVDYKLTDRLTAFARTDFYGQNISEFLPYSLSRRRYFGGLEITITRAPELAGDPHLHRPMPPASPDAQTTEGKTPEDHK